MKDELYISNLIDQFLSGKLSPEEKINFEQMMQNDADFAQEVELERIIKGAVIDNSLLDWKKAIAEETKRQSNRKKNKYLLIAGACIMAILISGMAIFLTSNKDKKETTRPSKATKETSTIIVKEEIETNINSVEKTDTETKNKKSIPFNDQKIIIPNTSETLKNEKKTIVTNTQESKSKAQKTDSIPLTHLSKTEEKFLETKNTHSVIDPCEKVTFTTEIKTIVTCEGQSEGQIILSNTKGGFGEYSYSLKDVGNWQSAGNFNGLQSDYYSIVIKDQKGCIFTIPQEVFVAEQYCYKPEIGFNPDFETWEYKAFWTDEVEFKIIDKTGQFIIKETVTDDFEWNGTNQQGEKVPVGLYRYYIKTGKETKSGTITVMY